MFLRLTKALATGALFANSLVTFADSIWDKPTVWERASFAKSTIEGQVKTIAHDEARNRILVRVRSNSGLKTLKICYDGVQSANQQSDSGFVSTNPHLQMITSAMDEGKKVSLTYGGTWDRCIRSVKVEKTDKLGGVDVLSGYYGLHLSPI